MKSNYGREVRLTDTRLRTELLKYEHMMFRDNADNIGVQMMAAVLYSVHLRLNETEVDEEYRRSRLRQIVDDTKAILQMDCLPGKGLSGGDLVSFIKTEYGIDLDKEIHLNLESEKEYLKRNKE